MCLDDLLTDEQPKPRPMNIWFQLWITEKAVENMRQVALWDTWPMIFDVYNYSLIFYRFYCNPYPRTWSILNSIVE